MIQRCEFQVNKTTKIQSEIFLLIFLFKTKIQIQFKNLKGATLIVNKIIVIFIELELVGLVGHLWLRQ